MACYTSFPRGRGKTSSPKNIGTHGTLFFTNSFHPLNFYDPSTLLTWYLQLKLILQQNCSTFFHSAFVKLKYILHTFQY